MRCSLRTPNPWRPRWATTMSRTGVVQPGSSWPREAQVDDERNQEGVAEQWMLVCGTNIERISHMQLEYYVVYCVTVQIEYIMEVFDWGHPRTDLSQGGVDDWNMVDPITFMDDVKSAITLASTRWMSWIGFWWFSGGWVYITIEHDDVFGR